MTLISQSVYSMSCHVHTSIYKNEKSKTQYISFMYDHAKVSKFKYAINNSIHSFV